MKKIKYTFRNGMTITFNVVPSNKQKPIESVTWSRDPHGIKSLVEEYINDCVPYVYQKIADMIGEPLLWVDPHTLQTKRFVPCK